MTQTKHDTCTRCSADVPSILSPPIDDRDTWWRYLIGFQRREVTVTMRFRMFKRQWLPERASDVLSETYTELTLCDPCAGDLLLIAQGLDPKRTVTAVAG